MGWYLVVFIISMGDNTLHTPLLVWLHQFAMYDQKIVFKVGFVPCI